MIPDVASLALLCGLAGAQDVVPTPPPAAPPPTAPVVEDVLSPYRVPFDALVERSIGTASVPVAFDWRHTKVQLAGSVSYLAELNNFNAMRGGAIIRRPASGMILELGVMYAETWESPTSRLLMYTPYRQPARPDRLEVDLMLGVPLAEGVVTAQPKFFPATQMVLNAYGGLRYLIYPSAFRGMEVGEVLGAIVAPALSEEEIDELEDARLPGMQIDPARYGLMLGLGNDIYFEPGLFVSPRVLFAVPLLAPATQTDLFLWVDLSLAVGIAL